MKFSNFGQILALLCLSGASAFAPSTSKSPLLNKKSSRGSNGIATLTPTSLFASEPKGLQNLNQKTPTSEELELWLSGYGEKSRAYRRNVFTAADWVRARRPERFIDNIMTTFESGLIRQIQQEVTYVFLTAFFVVFYNDVFVFGFDLFGQHFDGMMAGTFPKAVLPLPAFTLCSGALGLLLTFRTNVSYQRWNEARTAWGKIINDSRSIARMGCIWGKTYVGANDEELQKLGEAICAFSRSVMNRTLPPQEDEENFKTYARTRMMDQNYAESLISAKHRPTATLAEITRILVSWDLNPLHQVEVEKVVTGLCDALGACERIFTSPVPTFYVRHTARFLAFWLFTLPLGLYEPFGGSWNHFGMIPVVTVIAAFFLGIEELATEMEEPFSILPMEKMSEGSIRTPVMEQVERSQNRGANLRSANPPNAGAAALPATAAAATVIPESISKNLSSEDMDKLQQYFPQGGASASPPAAAAPTPAPAAPAQSLEELNKLWAQQSGSQNQ